MPISTKANDVDDVAPGDIDTSWRTQLLEGISGLLSQPSVAATLASEHTQGTPLRVLKMFDEMFSGCHLNTKKILMSARFSSNGYQQMIHVPQISFYSMCAHHLLPFIGKAHFAYIPGEYIVGLSKIPRLVEAFSQRPQIQEKLTSEIVSAFMDVVEPQGCAVMLRARHCCMECRGVKASTAYMETTDLRGTFLSNSRVREEFLMAASAHKGDFA